MRTRPFDMSSELARPNIRMTASSIFRRSRWLQKLLLLVLIVSGVAPSLSFAQNSTNWAMLVGTHGDFKIHRYNAATWQEDTTPFWSPPGVSEIFVGRDTNMYYALGKFWGKVCSYNRTTLASIGEVVVTTGVQYDNTESAGVGPDGALYASGALFHRIGRYGSTTNHTYISDNNLTAASHFTFGPDGDFYVANNAPNTNYYQGTATTWANVLRYDGKNGAFKGVFVPRGSGGLGDPWCVEFGPDANLYVLSSSNGVPLVLRYDGKTGQFKDLFVRPEDNVGYGQRGGKMRFGPDANLYITDWQSNCVRRFSGSSGAYMDTVATNIQADGWAPPGPFTLAFDQTNAPLPQVSVVQTPQIAATNAQTVSLRWGVSNNTGQVLTNLVSFSYTNTVGQEIIRRVSFGAEATATNVEVTLTGLLPSTTYSYWVQSGAYVAGKYYHYRDDANGTHYTFTTSGSSGETMLVGNASNGEVMRFDPVTGQYLDTFIQGSSGGAMAAGTNGIYVLGQTNLNAYSTATGELLGSYGLGSGWTTPKQMQLGADGKLYISDLATGKIGTFDPTTATFTTGVVQDTNHLVSAGNFAFGTTGDIYVINNRLDGYNGPVTAFDNVLRYTTNGVFVGEFICTPSDPWVRLESLAFGLDGNLYVGWQDSRVGGVAQVMRYDGETGELLGTFVTADSGGLGRIGSLTFGPDGDLYISDPDDNSIKRYDGNTGTYLGDFVTSGTGTVSSVGGMLFTTTTNLPTSVGFTASNYAVDEGRGNVTVTVMRSGNRSGTVTVNYQTSDGTAKAGVHYQAVSGQLVFSDDDTYKQFVVPIYDDGQIGADRSFNVSLSDLSSSATLGMAQAQVTIHDNYAGHWTMLVGTWEEYAIHRYDMQSWTQGSFFGPNSTDEVFFGANTNYYYTLASWWGQVITYNRTTLVEVGQRHSITNGLWADVPETACFGADGALYASSSLRHRIGRYADTANHDYICDNNLTRPEHFTLGPDGDFYVANAWPDPNNNFYTGTATTACNILRYDGKTGAFKEVFVPQSSGGLEEPLCVEFGPDANLYVLSITNGVPQVLRYDGSTGQFKDIFVKPQDNGGLGWRMYLRMRMRFGPDGNLYILDFANNCVRRYDGNTGAYMDTVVENVDPRPRDVNRGPASLTFDRLNTPPPQVHIVQTPVLTATNAQTATLRWGVENNTGQPLTNLVYYSWTNLQGQTLTNRLMFGSDAWTTAPTVTLTNLQRGTSYNYWVQSAAYIAGKYYLSRDDSNGTNYTFSTGTLIDITTEPAVTAQSPNSVIVNWSLLNRTGLDVTNSIFYTDATNGVHVFEKTISANEQYVSIKLTGLLPGTTNNFLVQSFNYLDSVVSTGSFATTAAYLQMTNGLQQGGYWGNSTTINWDIGGNNRTAFSLIHNTLNVSWSNASGSGNYSLSDYVPSSQSSANFTLRDLSPGTTYYVTGQSSIAGHEGETGYSQTQNISFTTDTNLPVASLLLNNVQVVQDPGTNRASVIWNVSYANSNEVGRASHFVMLSSNTPPASIEQTIIAGGSETNGTVTTLLAGLPYGRTYYFYVQSILDATPGRYAINNNSNTFYCFTNTSPGVADAGSIVIDAVTNHLVAQRDALVGWQTVTVGTTNQPSHFVVFNQGSRPTLQASLIAPGYSDDATNTLSYLGGLVAGHTYHYYVQSVLDFADGHQATDTNSGSFYQLTTADINEGTLDSTINDGIPDWWKLKYGFNPLDPSVKYQDADNDGLSNYAEYLLSSDPRNAASRGTVLDNWRETVGTTHALVSWRVQNPNPSLHLKYQVYWDGAISSGTVEGIGGDSGPVSAFIDDLDPNETYAYCVITSVYEGTTLIGSIITPPPSQDMREFTTLANAPVITQPQVAGGADSSMALTSTGDVWTWGGGILGNNMPMVTGLAATNMVSISVGQGHAVAVDTLGSVWSWGDNDFGQLGVEGTGGTNLPIRIVAAGTCRVVAAGGKHTVVLKTDGSVWAWGGNWAGQLGLGTNQPVQATPTQVPVDNMTNVTSVAAGWDYTVLLRADGTVWTFGGNEFGQLGTGGVGPSYYPTQITNLNNVVSIFAGPRHCFARCADGTIWGWGANEFRQIGAGTNTSEYAPVQVPTGTAISTIRTGWSHSLFLASNGSLFASGGNTFGQLGTGTSQPQSTLTSVSLTNTVSTIGAGWDHSLGVNSNGVISTWGLNSSGQLGDGTLTNHFLPVEVMDLPLSEP